MVLCDGVGILFEKNNICWSHIPPWNRSKAQGQWWKRLSERPLRVICWKHCWKLWDCIAPGQYCAIAKMMDGWKPLYLLNKLQFFWTKLWTLNKTEAKVTCFCKTIDSNCQIGNKKRNYLTIKLYELLFQMSLQLLTQIQTNCSICKH